MNILKIGIIDDDPSKVTQIITKLIQGFSKASPEKSTRYSGYTFEPYVIELENDLCDVVDNIYNLRLDSIIVDYNLSSMQTVNYTGVELAKEVEATILGYPVFILTSFEDELFDKETYNAYQVFDSERYLSEDAEQTELNFKIVEQILKTRKQRENWERELIGILPCAGDSVEIDSRILELDCNLENGINAFHAIPEKTKKDLSSNQLSELISKIDQILLKE